MATPDEQIVVGVNGSNIHLHGQTAKDISLITNGNLCHQCDKVTTVSRYKGLDDLDVINVSHPSGVVSDYALEWFVLVNYVVLSGGISFCGVITNILNIIVFVRQGFGDTVNISLLGLGISDLGGSLTMLWMSVCFTPWFRHSYDFGMDALKIQYLTAAWPHACFARITSYITAFITFERCLCIALPLKVKTIITPRRTFLVVAGIYFLMIASVAPVFYAARFTIVFKEDANKSVFSFYYVENGPVIESVSFSIYVFAQISAFVLVIVCTSILIQSLVRKSKWRKSTASVDDSSASRDKRVMKMIMSVAIIFIVCFFPTAVNLLMMIYVAEYSLVGRESNLFLTCWGFLNNLESVNATVNIFIYYKMSTKYRAQMQSLVCLKSGKTKQDKGKPELPDQDS